MPAPSPRPLPRPARRPSRAAATALAAVLALAAVSAPAEGQLLKRIKQAAQDKVAGTIGRTVVGADEATPAGGAAGGAAGSPAGGAAAGAPAAKKGPTPITAERLEVFLVAMRPAIDAAERGRAAFAARKAYAEASARYEAAGKRYQACFEPILQRERPRLAALAARDPSVMARLQGHVPGQEALYEAQQQAMARQDAARLNAIGDSIKVLQIREFVRLVPALRDCGEVPRKPAEPKAAGETTPEQAITPPAGMTRAQFGRLRERVAVYALTGGTQDPFTAEERAVLDARAADLARLAPLFRDGLLEWGQWGAESNLGRRWNPPAPGAEPSGA